MPANWNDPTDHRVVRWRGMGFQKSDRVIRKLPMRLSALSLETPWACIHTLANLISNDALALAMWEAL